jgi:hypothetical protein
MHYIRLFISSTTCCSTCLRMNANPKHGAQSFHQFPGAIGPGLETALEDWLDIPARVDWVKDEESVASYYHLTRTFEPCNSAFRRSYRPGECRTVLERWTTRGESGADKEYDWGVVVNLTRTKTLWFARLVVVHVGGWWYKSSPLLDGEMKIVPGAIRRFRWVSLGGIFTQDLRSVESRNSMQKIIARGETAFRSDGVPLLRNPIKGHADQKTRV